MIRRALMMRRRHWRRREVPYESIADTRTTQGEASDAVDLVERALRHLSIPLRHVFVLRVMEGHSHAEIAALLSIAVGTSEMRYSRALRIVRSQLEDLR